MNSPSMASAPCAVNVARYAWRCCARIRRSGVRVLAVIAELDAAGGCFASLAWIAARAGVHRNTARRWIRVAEQAGFLLVVPQRNERGATRSSLLVPSAPVLPSGAASAAVLRAAEHREACEASWVPMRPQRWEGARNERGAAKPQENGLGVPLPRPIFGLAAELVIPGFDFDREDPPDVLDRLFGRST